MRDYATLVALGAVAAIAAARIDPFDLRRRAILALAGGNTVIANCHFDGTVSAVPNEPSIIERNTFSPVGLCLKGSS